MDFDEVTADFISYFLYFHNLMYKTEMKKGEVSSYFLYEAFDIDKKEMGIRLAEFRSLKLLERIEPSEGAVEGIKKLLEMGYSPHFVTARPETLKEETINWLKKYFKDMEFPVYFTHREAGMPSLKKSEICKSIGAEILIDDYIENALDCAENGIKVFLMDAPWNQTGSLPANVIRVKSWKELITKIN